MTRVFLIRLLALAAPVWALLAPVPLCHASSLAEEREALHARRFAQEGRPELVVGQCRQFRERFPSSTLGDQVLDLEGRAWLALERPAEALAAFQSLVQRHGLSSLAPAAQLAAGECQWRLGRRNEADKAWRRLAQQYPDSPEAVKGLLRAEETVAAGHLEVREELLRLAAELDSESDDGLEARRRWATLLVEQGRSDAAIQMLERVLREAAPGPAHLRALSELDALLEQDQRGEEALALLVRQVPLYEDDPLRGSLALRLAQRRLALGRPGEAERGLRSLLDEGALTGVPRIQVDSLWLRLGEALYLQARHDDAEAVWREPAARNGSLLLRRALGREEAGDVAGAADLLSQALAAQEFDTPRQEALALTRLAVLQVDFGVPGLAWGELARHAGRVDSAWPEALELARALRDQGHRPEAARLLDPRGDRPWNEDRRGLLRLQLAVDEQDWSRAAELARIFRERWPLSPLAAVADSLEQERVLPAARAKELDRRLRQLAGSGDPRSRLETGWLHLRERRRPAEALDAFRSLPVDSPEDLAAEAAHGRLQALVALGRAEEAQDEWEDADRRLARSPWALAALRSLWSLSPTPSAEERRARIALLESLRKSVRLDRVALAGALLDQWDALREQIAGEGGSVQSQQDCARRALQWADSLNEPEPARLLARALCRETVGDAEGARTDWRRLLREARGDPAFLVAARKLALNAETDSSLRREIVDGARDEWPWHPLSRTLRLEVAVRERKAGHPGSSLSLCEGLREEAGDAGVQSPLPVKEDPALLEELGLALEALGRHDEARCTWLLALAGCLDDSLRAPRLRLLAARSFRHSGRADAAARLAEVVLTAHPDTPQVVGAVRLLAGLDSEAGRHEEALRRLEELRPGAKSDLTLRAQWLKALARLGREARIKEELSRLLKDGKGRLDEDTLRASLGWEKGEGLLERGQPAEAAKAFAQVADKQGRTPRAPWAQLGAARSLQALGDAKGLDKALAALDKRWPDSPAAAEGKALRGRALEAAGDPGSALKAWEQAAEGTSGEARRLALGAWADAAARLQRPGQERQALELLLNEFPQSPDGLEHRLRLALALAATGESPQARAALRGLQGEADATRAAEIQYRLGELAEQQGDLADAVLEYQKVPHLADDSRLDWAAAALFAAARCWEELGRPAEAVSTLEQVRARYGAGSAHGLRAVLDLERLANSTE
jgi:TolA-binding protein